MQSARSCWAKYTVPVITKARSRMSQLPIFEPVVKPALSPFAQFHLPLSVLPTLIFNGLFSPSFCDTHICIWAIYLWYEWCYTVLKRHNLSKRLLNNRWKGQQSKGVTSRGCIKHNNTEIHRVNQPGEKKPTDYIKNSSILGLLIIVYTLPHNFCKTHCLINSWKCPKKLFHHVLTHGHNIYRKVIIQYNSLLVTNW